MGQYRQHILEIEHAPCNAHEEGEGVIIPFQDIEGFRYLYQKIIVGRYAAIVI